MNTDERIIKEKFVTGNKGGQFGELLLITISFPIAAAFDRVVISKSISKLQSMLLLSSKIEMIIHYILSFINIFAVLYICNIEPNYIINYNVTLILTIFVFLILNRGNRLINYESLNMPTKAFITVYRSFMMLATCFTILAVDFIQIFPKRFIKVEDYGISLMDVGVGSFIFSGAIISRKARGINIKKSSFENLYNSFFLILPLVILGFGRFIVIKSFGYQEHITEYGIHWNFFMTLAIVYLFDAIFNIPTEYTLFVGTSILIVYQFLLSYFGINEYILHAPRVNFFSQNREGIFSCLGYISIYYISQYFGGKIMKSRNYSSWWKFAISLNLLSMALWFVNYVIIEYFKIEPSRRMANLTYVIYILVNNLFALANTLIADLITGTESNILISSVSSQRNSQLIVFLAANIFTGLINLFAKTQEKGKFEGAIILFFYMLVVNLVPMIIKNIFDKIKVSKKE